MDRKQLMSGAKLTFQVLRISCEEWPQYSPEINLVGYSVVCFEGQGLY